MSDTPRLRARLFAPGVLLLAAAILLMLLFGGTTRRAATDLSGARRAAFTPIFLPVYEIESVSGNHHASILNLPLPYVGAPQVPVPVDINGDLLPDVTFAVNLIDAQGIFNNPPQIGQLIAPNIAINRLVTAPILTPGGDPLRINLKFTVQDASNQNPNIVVRFGYDTGPGGTIPPNYKAVVSGLDTLFNPLTARIDTTGGLVLGLDPTLPDLGLVPQSNAYEGPLSTWVALDTGPALRVDADLRFEPMPNLLQFTYGTEDATQQITVAHAAPREIDLRVNGSISMEDSEGSTTEADLSARIDRLPKRVAVDFATAGDEGAVRYETDSGPGVRLPDLSATIDMRQDDEPPLIARVDMESLPDLMTANWVLPDGAPPTVTFDAAGQGIGAIEARIQNYEGAPTAFTEWVPGERQHVSIQAGPGGLLEDDTLIQARVERIRHADFTGLPDGTLQGTVNIGDGELPLEVHGEIDLRSDDPEGSGPYINATATLSPLPDELSFAMTPTSEEDPTQPMVVHFAPSESMDIDVDALVGLPGTEGALECGDGGTACANLQIRNVPTDITAALTNLESESRIQVDMVPRPGGAPLDIFGSATLGPVDLGGNPVTDLLLAAPVHAEFSLVGLPEHVSVRMLENEAGDLERVDVRPCQLDFATGECTDPEGEIAEVTFGVRNWLERPADLPAPPQSGPLYVTAVARGTEPAPGEYLVRYEATGRVTDIRGLTYIGAGDLTAARVDIGGNQDLRLYVDAQDIDINGDDPGGRIDVSADVRVEDLPSPMVFCFAESGRILPADGPLDPITANCEGTDPFGDGTVGAGDPGPLTISYDAPAPFDASADIVIEGDLPIVLPDAIPLDFGAFRRVAAQVALTDIPSDFTAYIGSPAETAAIDPDANTVATATRVRTVAPGASNTSIELAAQITTEGADCADPGTVGGAICADLEISTLPDYTSVLFSTLTDQGDDPDDTSDDEVLDTQVGFHACDYRFFDPTPGCTPGTEGEIGVIDVDLRAHAGSTASVPPYVAPDSGPLVYALGDLDDYGNFELQAGLRVEHLRSIDFHKTPEEMHAATDIGTGVDPLRVHAYLDTRDATTILEDELLRAQAVADITLDPLPQQVTFDQVGPGADQSRTTIDLTSSETAVLTVDAEVREAGVADGAACGVRGTYCAELSVDSLPNTIHVQIDRDATAPIDPVDDTRPTKNQVHIDQTRFPGQGPEDKADIEVHAAIGLPFTAPIVGDGSLFADVVMTGVPDHVSMAMDNREVIDTSTGDAIEDASTLERFQIHTCNRDFDNEVCLADSVSPLDQLDVSVRSFDLRPTDFPAPPSVAEAPFYIGAAGRGNLLEAVARFHEVSEVQFLNQGGMTAATAKAGGGADFQVNVDIEDLPLGGLLSVLDLGLIQVAQPTATVKVQADITPFPGDLSFCLRDGGLAMPADSPITFTDICEQTDPFDADNDGNYMEAGGPSTTPLSIGFDANTSFDVHVDAEVAIDGLDPDTVDDPTPTAIPQQRVFGRLALEDLPSELAVHFLQPVTEGDQTSGPYHGVVRSPGATSGIDITLAAGYLVGADTICEDPRPGRSATCVSFGDFETGVPGIENLPTEAEFFYNPDLDPYSLTPAQLTDPDVMTNFTIHTEGTAATRFNKLRISSVNPPVDLPVAEVPLLGELDTDAFIAEIDLEDLPNPFDIRGTLLLTDESPTATFEVLDGPTPGVDAVPGVQVHLQNFLAPDPTAGATPPARSVEDDPNTPTHTISAYQRGPAVKVDASIVSVRSFGIRPVRSGNAASDRFRHPLGTTVINAGFEGDFNIRAFVDLMPEPGFRVIGDVLIGDIPMETNVCIRGPRALETDPNSPDYDLPNKDLPIAGTGTWCDNPANIDPGEGALEIAQVPNTFGRKMDIDAFARIQYGGGSSVIAGRVDIRQMPQIIRGRFGGTSGKDIELSTFSWGGASGDVALPDGINRISFEAASFDLANSDTGYDSVLPYEPLDGPVKAKEAPGGGGTFGPDVDREFIHAAADLSAGLDSFANIGFHVRGQIGLDNEGVPSSQFQHLLYSGDPCEVPVDAFGQPRGDYPAIPEDDDTAGYTCIRVDFEEPVPGVNPLDLDAFALLPGRQALRLHDAGISDLPQWIQVQLAEAETFTDPENKRGWRRPCPSLDDIAADSSRAGGCMAPLLRFDQPAETYLFGQAEFGPIDKLYLLSDPSTNPVQAAPDFNAAPTGSSWSNGSGQDYQEGIRLKVVAFGGETVSELADDGIAARANLRLQIPGSLQVEQIQKFSLDLRQKNQDGEHIGGDKAEDLRMGFTVRRPNGTLKTSVGELAAMVHLAPSGAQILLTEPCPSSADILGDEPSEQTDLARGSSRPQCDTYTDGIDLPGHVALTMYIRNHLEDTEVGGDEKLRQSTFVQVDGRVSAEMNIGARFYGNGLALLSGGPTDGIFTGDGVVTAGTAEVAIRGLPSSGSTMGAHFYDPDFRFRAEIISDGDRPKDDPDPSTFSEEGAFNAESDCEPYCLDEWYEFNFHYRIGIERAFVGFDMSPAGSSTGPAKMLDAVIHLNTPQIGADLSAWEDLDRTNPAEISLGVGVAVSPLDFEVKSKSNIGANLDKLVHKFITETIGAPDWLADIIGFIIKPITALIDAILNALPIGLELVSDFFLQFSVDRLSSFTLRNNILHAFMDGEGDGHARFGPINWYIDKFSGGLYFDIPKIKIPKWICWVPGIPCSIDPPAILLLGYGYLDGLPVGDLGLPIIMDFRDCDAAGGVGSILPFVGGGFDNTVELDPEDGEDDGFFARAEDWLTGGDDEDFVLWVGTDPRMSFGGLLARALDFFTGKAFTSVLDLIIDIVVGPVVCHLDFFSIDQTQNRFVGVSYTGDPNTFHPGTPNSGLFPGHPVPGQPAQLTRLPEATEEAPTGPILFPPEDPSADPPLPEPPVPPTGVAPKYAGLDVDVTGSFALCGVHEYNSFDVLAGGAITVATTPNNANLLGDGPACPAADVGTLEIRANTISIAQGGSITGNETQATVPDLGLEIPPEIADLFDPPLVDPADFTALYAATGSSGGTNAGVGSNGSAPEAGFQNYEEGTDSTDVFPGSPGSSVGTNFDLQSIAPDVAAPDTVNSAGPAGRGGAAIKLLADTAVTIDGVLTANGGHGASNTTVECDNDPDDNGIPGLQQHVNDNGTPSDPSDDFMEDNEILDPAYEHGSGFIGSGGGAGGGIAIEAEHGAVTLGGSGVLAARGGNGGAGGLGSGGGGGGGAIKILAASSNITSSDMDVSGGVDGSTASFCDGIPAPTAQTFDDPLTPVVETGFLPHNGFKQFFERPWAEIRPYGPFWWAGGPVAPENTITTYYNGAAMPGTTLYVCAVRVPVGATYDAAPDDGEVDLPVLAGGLPWDDTRDDPIPFTADALAGALGQALPYQTVVDDGSGLVTETFGTMPSAANHCGSPAPNTINAGPGGVVLQQLAAVSLSGTHHGTPLTLGLDLNDTYLYGVYTVAIRGSVVEELSGIEWAFGVDATRPNAEILNPVDTPMLQTNVAGVQVDFVSDDILRATRYYAPDSTMPLVDEIPDTEFILSGVNRTQCRIYPSNVLGATPGPEEGWAPCAAHAFRQLHQPDGIKTIEVRAFDTAGNVSDITADIDGDGEDGRVQVLLAIDPPQSTLQLNGGVQGDLVPADQLVDPSDAGARWYRVAPEMRITGYSSVATSADSPYVYKFDNGGERGCENEAIPDTSPPDCVLTGPQLEELLSTGGHSIRYTAVNVTGTRYVDDNDASTPSPMPRRGLYLDTEPPYVELSTVPLRPDKSFGGNDWYSEQIVPFVSAIDQFGGSGVSTIEYRFGAAPYQTFDPANPPAVPSGSSTFCYRVTDHAGNQTTGCRDLREDADVPSFALTTVGGVLGGGGWYTAAPSFTATSYDDNVPTGVGIDSGHFRTRVDNSSYTACSAPSCPFGAGLTTGTHLVHASAVDRFGNRSGEQTRTVRVDLEPPQVVPVIGPSEPDGENGWWHTGPYLTLFADDPGEGSGVDPAALQYSLDGGATWTTWTEPVRVGAGEHHLCWRGADIAGNQTGTSCTEFFVDLDDPTASITAPADPPSGWFGANVNLTAGSADAAPGSGFGAADPADVCEDLTPAASATDIAGLCVSVDGGPYRPYTGQVTAGEGIHTVRAYSIDRSGRRSAVVERIVHVDKSRPVVELRRIPRDPAELVNNWYRVPPLVVLRADDGWQGSGVLSLEQQIDGGAFTPYQRPFELGNGVHTVQTRATDMVGTATTSTQVKVDTVHPTAEARAPEKLIWLRLLGLGGNNTLNYRIGDNLSGKVQVWVIIYDATGMPVRKISGGTKTVTPGGFVNGGVVWDGKDGSLLNLVPLGIYYYRVVAIDEAGHVTQSGESPRITIRVL